MTVEQPLVLVREDLHWNDRATLDLLAWLARRREPARLLVMGTYRPVDVVVHGHPLKAVKQDLDLHQQCVEVRLEGPGT
jgi:predicted ATPase